MRPDRGLATAVLADGDPSVEIDGCATSGLGIFCDPSVGKFQVYDDGNWSPLPDENVFVEPEAFFGGPGSSFRVRFTAGTGMVGSTLVVPADFAMITSTQGRWLSVSWSPSGSGDPMSAGVSWSCQDGSSWTGRIRSGIPSWRATPATS